MYERTSGIANNDQSLAVAWKCGNYT